MQTRTLTYLITQKEEGLTATSFLKSIGYSHRILVHLRQTPDSLWIGSSPIRGSRILKAGDCLIVHLRETADSENIVPTDIPLHVVYEDEDLLVINKQPGLSIHPSQGHYDNTLGNALKFYFKDRPFTCRIINRLDRDTTGLLIVAKNMLSAALLSEMVRNREIHREYLAALTGDPDTLLSSACPAGVKRNPEEEPTFQITAPPLCSFSVTAPIARTADSTIERCVDFTRGEPARTYVHELLFDSVSGYSLAALRLESGRTHQIRVHMNYIGCPLPGDFLYHPDFSRISRQALHSHCLSFLHPITKKEMLFYAPLPDDIRSLFPHSDLTFLPLSH